ncbi:MAG: SAM-dependent methyltransferase [Bacteroidales bacterium]|jgi:16S rRNA (cytidine1402-2'-O)-methyltransferase|nr:SAM-dependent methyltransferase [Bacteroidales bacterium]
MNNKRGILYLIPSPLGDNPVEEVIPSYAIAKMCSLKYFVVEEISTARRYLSRAGLKGKIEGLQFYELNEHTEPEVARGYVKLLLDGNDVGIISEAGLPAVADPGNLLVAEAQKNEIEIVPFAGPSSLMMALMASGLNGQGFAFNGYIPVKEGPRRAKIKELETLSKRTGQTQIIIETPYRNDALLADMLAVCSGGTRLCIAADISLPTAYIKTKSVAEWKELKEFRINKRPCVFILQG